MKKLVLFYGLILGLAACQHSENGFIHQRKQHDWSLPPQVFSEPVAWDQQVTKILNHAGCPVYLADYIKQSSDIISNNHQFPYAHFDLNDHCAETLLQFIRFYLAHHSHNPEVVSYTLDISHNPRLSNRIVAYMIEVIREFPAIKRVKLTGNLQISDDAIRVLQLETNALVVM